MESYSFNTENPSLKISASSNIAIPWWHGLGCMLPSQEEKLAEPVTYSDHVSSCNDLDDSDNEDDSDLETSSSWLSWLGL